MVVDENATRLQRLDDLGKTVDALQRVIIQAEDELGLFQRVAGTQFVLGIDYQFPHAGYKFQRLGRHVGSDDNGILAQAAQHVAQRQRRAQGITVGRLVARDDYALHAVDKGTQPFYSMFVNNWTDHCLKIALIGKDNTFSPQEPSFA